MDLLVLFATFGILFIGELGDKTQLIVFNLSLEHEKPYKVGVGATIGFAIIVSLGVFFGAVITNFIPISIITMISGAVFILIGLIEIPGIKKLYNEKQAKELKIGTVGVDEDGELDQKDLSPQRLSKIKKNPYLSGFFFIFLMELGDKTQILTITLASVYDSLIEVWIGSFLALTCLAWMGVFFGALIARKVPKLYLKLGSTVIFIIIGVITLLAFIA